MRDAPAKGLPDVAPGQSRNGGVLGRTSRSSDCSSFSIAPAGDASSAQKNLPPGVRRDPLYCLEEINRELLFQCDAGSEPDSPNRVKPVTTNRRHSTASADPRFKQL